VTDPIRIKGFIQ